MTPQTNAERQAAFVRRQRRAGMQLVRLWVHEQDADRLRKYAARLNKAREKA